MNAPKLNPLKRDSPTLTKSVNVIRPVHAWFSVSKAHAFSDSFVGVFCG